ncbi:HAD-like protein [Ramaria rubella]|nr:HAD-like protein [Ramaria rubella]
MFPTVTIIVVDAVLFDMDGTLVDSTQGVVGAWEIFKETYPRIDVQRVLDTAHGVRTVENLRKFCGIEDPAALESEAVRFEIEIVNASRKNGGKGIVRLPGVRAVMDVMHPHASLPNPSWAICTSATRTYALSALDVADVPVPEVLITAEDVEQGKPAPDPYILGAKKCGVSPRRCLVIEDAPNGVRSGQAAGCKVLGVVTSHTEDQMRACGPDFLVRDLGSVQMRVTSAGVEVTMDILATR